LQGTSSLRELPEPGFRTVHPPEDLETEENGEEGVANQNATRMDARRLREAEKPHEGRHVAGDGGLQPADLRDLGGEHRAGPAS
jgi:hypothetical protein